MDDANNCWLADWRRAHAYCHCCQTLLWNSRSEAVVFYGLMACEFFFSLDWYYLSYFRSLNLSISLQDRPLLRPIISNLLLPLPWRLHQYSIYYLIKPKFCAWLWLPSLTISRQQTYLLCALTELFDIGICSWKFLLTVTHCLRWFLFYLGSQVDQKRLFDCYCQSSCPLRYQALHHQF